MLLIQNLHCIPLSFKGKNIKIPLEKSLEGKFLHSCFVLSSEEDCVIFSPYKNEMLTQLFDNEHLHFFLSLNDETKKHEINNAFFSIKNYNVKFSPFKINKEIDTEKSFFFSESTFENAGANTSLYFTWGEKEKKYFDKKISEQAEFQLTKNANTVTFLNEFVNSELLKGKKIKKIGCKINESYSPAYLDIICKDGRKMEYIPASLLQLPDEFEIFFDNIEIDLEKSRFLIPTFNEKEYKYEIRFGW
ncbi:hypothetical protein TRIP_D300112 [uncultured Paludibacter sp.]|uniref:Uncharacterized protein n=1 Tax=uncultured Paludibacter sp. TaxID=497635 RepID=A0A653AB21_9BACT|nr:hypothetical protein TRIP_D300112 [uncultured Paludibacter sp.]